MLESKALFNFENFFGLQNKITYYDSFGTEDFPSFGTMFDDAAS